MSNIKRIRLPEKFIDYLIKLPESGMGYQVVDITLANGIVLEKRIIINSTYLQIDEHENPDDFDVDSIMGIKLHIA